MRKITNQDVVNGLRTLPDKKKQMLAIEANLRGINIEKDIVPVIVNVANVCNEVAERVAENYKLLLGENYKFLNK
jgi:hypothetical protein